MNPSYANGQQHLACGTAVMSRKALQRHSGMPQRARFVCRCGNMSGPLLLLGAQRGILENCLSEVA